MAWPRGKKREYKRVLTLPEWWPYKVDCSECSARALFNDLEAHDPNCTIMRDIRAKIHPLHREEGRITGELSPERRQEIARAFTRAHWERHDA